MICWCCVERAASWCVCFVWLTHTYVEYIDEEELAELGQGLGLAQRSLVFIPVNDAEEFFSGCTHWYVPNVSALIGQLWCG